MNLHDLVVENTLSTYFIRVRGDSMKGAGIKDGDVVVVDKSLPPWHNAVVVVQIGERLLLKRLHIRGSHLLLYADPPDEQPLLFNEQADMEIWGTITFCVHDCRR